MGRLEDIDFLPAFRTYAATSPEDFDGRLSEDWVREMCANALDIALAQCPGMRRRWSNGYLTERTVTYVVCMMVLRVARWRRTQRESNGTYSYQDYQPSQVPQGYETSTDLFLTKQEKSLLNGDSDESQPIGSTVMGLAAGWG